ncbi:MAG: 5-formyltetrahydrofolate cyclo-ligase [Candidatus Saccharimonadales bacterium]
MDKQQLRDMMNKKRQSLSQSDVNVCSRAILERFGSEVSLSHVQHAHVYQANSSRREVNTSYFMSYIEEKSSGSIVHIPADSPSARKDSIEFDLIIVPLLAFDADCNRLGLGAGWYDAFLASQPKALKVGLAYDFQYVSRVPVETHDIPLDIIITQSATFQPSTRSVS